MKYTVITDVHSNLPALDAVMLHAPKKDSGRVRCLGDVVGYNPNPNECLERADGYVDSFVPGNHDIAVYNLFCRSHGKQSSVIHTDFEFNSKALFAARWNAEQLTKKSFGILERIVHQDHALNENGMIFAHSTPFEPEQMEYIENERGFRSYFLDHSEIKSSVAFVGHIHIQQIYFANIAKGGCWDISRDWLCFRKAADEVSNLEKLRPDMFVRQKKDDEPIIKEIDISSYDKALIVVPSVGQPRDGLNYTGYVTYDTETKKVRFVRIPYQMQGLLDKINDSVATGLPDCRNRLLNGE